MKEKQQQPTTVYLRQDVYFTVDDDQFHLFIEKEGTKAPRSHGHFTDMELLVRKAVRVLIADRKKTYFADSFIREWRAIQEELLNKTNI